MGESSLISMYYWDLTKEPGKAGELKVRCFRREGVAAPGQEDLVSLYEWLWSLETGGERFLREPAG